tara:strand:- start:1846 stop:2010 length:165 start_codon:yes stop_codon:yes gene_type:complete
LEELEWRQQVLVLLLHHLEYLHLVEPKPLLVNILFILLPLRVALLFPLFLDQEK